MSYLDLTRLNFRGYFQADVSTINNNVPNYDIDTFQPSEQDMSQGNWNPTGTGSFRLLDCKITGAVLNGVALPIDPALTVLVENSDLRVSGKLVDLDPQQQFVSEIWGMSVRLTLGGKHALLDGTYEPTGFINMWKRQVHPSAYNDQQLAAVYQSVLHNLDWQGEDQSGLLRALREQSKHGALSINMNVFGYGRDPKIPRYTMGHVVGSIGPWQPEEPKHFVIGRQMVASTHDFFLTQDGVNSFTCKVHHGAQMVSADLGNALPIHDANSGLEGLGDLTLAVYTGDTSTVVSSATPDQLAIIGTLPASVYMAEDWYAQTAGIVDFSYAGNAAVGEQIDSCLLVLLGPPQNDLYPVWVQETLGGLYLRADQFVYRLNPNQSADVELYASRFGQALANADITVFPNNSIIDAAFGPLSGPPTTPPTPDVGVPANGLEYFATLTTNQHGKATLQVKAASTGPGTPRGYIDGQVYGIGYSLAQQAPGYISNEWNFISVLAFSQTQVPAQPTWEADIKPIFQQYGNLYPIMSKYLFDLSSYEAVVKHLDLLRLAFSLPITDPNYMPVTRDLSADNLDMILKWMGPKGDPNPPLRGVVPVAQADPQASASTPHEGNLDDFDRGKSTGLNRLAAQRKAKRSQT